MELRTENKWPDIQVLESEIKTTEQHPNPKQNTIKNKNNTQLTRLQQNKRTCPNIANITVVRQAKETQEQHLINMAEETLMTGNCDKETMLKMIQDREQLKLEYAHLKKLLKEQKKQIITSLSVPGDKNSEILTNPHDIQVVIIQ